MLQKFLSYAWSRLIFLSNGVASAWALCLVMGIITALLVLLFGAIASLPGVLILVLLVHGHHLHFLLLKLCLDVRLGFQIWVQFLLGNVLTVLLTPVLVHDLHSMAHIVEFKMSSSIRADVPILVDGRPELDALIKNLSDLIFIQLRHKESLLKI